LFDFRKKIFIKLLALLKIIKCLGGGIGRHEGLKIPWPSGREGLIPSLGISLVEFLNCLNMYWWLEYIFK
jgi:hypothetical protein